MGKRKLFMLAISVVTIAIISNFVAVAFGASPSVSSTTGATIITDIRRYLNEPSTSCTSCFWSDSELLSWINDAQMDIAARTQCIENTVSITVAANTLMYSLNTTYIAVSAVQGYTPGDMTSVYGLQRGHARNVGHLQPRTYTKPELWYDWKGYLGVYPILANANGYMLTAYVVGEPTDLSATTSYISTPAIYDRAIKLYAASQALYKGGQYAKASRLMGEYYNEIDRYRQDYVIREKEPVDAVK